MGRDVAGAAVDGVISGIGMGVGEMIASVGTWTEECISGLIVYIAPPLTYTREVVDSFK